MLKNLSLCNLPAKFIILADNLEAKSHDIFVAFLNKHVEANPVKTIKIICTENPPNFYLKYIKNCHKIESHDLFSDQLGWNNESSTVISLEPFVTTSNSSEITYFIDSLHPLIELNGFPSVYKDLFKLHKISSNRIVCLVHSDLLSETNLEELKFLSSCFITLQKTFKTNDVFENSVCDEKTAEIIYRKSAGKIIKAIEIVSVDKNNFEITSKDKNLEKPTKEVQSTDDDIESLTTFKLSLNMSENERRAKSQLVLPYLRDSGKSSDSGQIVYNIEADDLEDDPDDDLDI